MSRATRLSRPRRRGARFALGLTLSALAVVALAGCQAVALVGMMARTFEETGNSTFAAEYDGLRGKSFAVIVSADRSIMGLYPDLVTRVSTLVTQRLANDGDTGASGFVPPRLVREFQLTTPTWTSWTYDQLREEFGVDRLIIIDISDFRLTEPGNQYLWDGLAIARVGVIEEGSPLPDDFIYSKDIRVQYPDNQGFTPNDMAARQVFQVLEFRLVNRVSWLFYEHEEANAIEY